ncbi:hypothetical protein UQW22_10025 [Isoptericola halotolerans]
MLNLPLALLCALAWGMDFGGLAPLWAALTVANAAAFLLTLTAEIGARS